MIRGGGCPQKHLQFAEMKEDNRSDPSPGRLRKRHLNDKMTTTRHARATLLRLANAPQVLMQRDAATGGLREGLDNNGQTFLFRCR